MRRPPAPGSDGPEQRSLEDKQPVAFAENPSFSAKRKASERMSFLGAQAAEPASTPVISNARRKRISPAFMLEGPTNRFGIFFLAE